jgi:hypothetical protein
MIRLIKLAMIRIDAEITQRKLRSRMTLQIHDELLFDILPAEAEELHALVKQEMEHVATFCHVARFGNVLSNKPRKRRRSSRARRIRQRRLLRCPAAFTIFGTLLCRGC